MEHGSASNVLLSATINDFIFQELNKHMISEALSLF